MKFSGWWPAECVQVGEPQRGSEGFCIEHQWGSEILLRITGERLNNGRRF